jgi:hypothetical protein
MDGKQQAATGKAASGNRLGLGLVVVGAAALAISVFLPLAQPVNALRMVQDNTLIQHEARARAIRLRIEAESNAKTAPGQQDSEPRQSRRAPESPRKETVAKPRNSPARANGLRLGDRVRVVAPGDDYLKVGTVTRILDAGEVDVKLGALSGTYTYGSDELEFLDRPIRW